MCSIFPGSYNESSLGGSLCSLTSRGYDGVAHSLAEAMQDDESLARSAQQQLFLGGQQQQQLNLLSPTPMVFNRSHSPAVGGISSKLLSAKRDSLFLCESDFPEVENSISIVPTITAGPATDDLLTEKLEAPTPPNFLFLMDEPEVLLTTPEISTPVVEAVTAPESACVKVATSLPLRMDFLGGGTGSLFSEESLSSSPSKPEACSSGGGDRQMSTKSRKTKRARKRANAKHKQMREHQKQEVEESSSPSTAVTTTSIMVNRRRRSKNADETRTIDEKQDKTVSLSPAKKQEHQEQQESSPNVNSPQFLLNQWILDEEADDDNGGWAAEIDRDSSY